MGGDSDIYPYDGKSIDSSYNNKPVVEHYPVGY